MAAENDFSILAKAATEARLFGYSAKELEENPAEAVELARSILENKEKLGMVSVRYVPILKSLLGLRLDEKQKEIAQRRVFDDSWRD